MARTCVVHLGHLVVVPEDGLSRVEGHRVDNLRLAALTLVAADHHLRKELRVLRPRIVLRHQPEWDTISACQIPQTRQ